MLYGKSQLGIVTLERNHDYSTALSIWDDTVEKNPGNYRAHNNRGNAYGNKGDLDKAIADYSQAIRLKPKYAKAWYNRGVAYRRKGDLDKAIDDYNQAIRIRPQYADAWYNRGVAYARKGDLDKAVADYSQAIRLDPEHAKAYNNRGNAYFNKGDLDKAIADYNQAVRSKPKFAEACNNLAFMLATHPEPQLRDGARAVRLAERACQLKNYKAPASLDTLAAAYAEAGQFDKAVETAEKAIQLARTAKNEKLAEDIQNRLDLYIAKRPYRTSVR